MAKIITGLVKSAVESLVDFPSTQLGYIWNYKSNFENLENQLWDLQNRNHMVQHSVDEAKRNGEEIEQHVVKWLDDANKMIDEVAWIIDDHKKTEMKCFKILCPNLKKRYQYSKNAAVKAMDVTELRNEGKFDRISYHTIPRDTWHPSIQFYENFESQMSTLMNVINALISPNVNVVGVYGMGGIGKTMLAREVGREVEENKLFDFVVFVEVTEQPDIIKIQGMIADMLGFIFREESQFGRARALCDRLKRERKLLLILDNIWESLDLEKVGIPLNDDCRGCKLLLTTRNKNVLLKMDCQRNFPIGILNVKEAWNLFEKIAGSCVQHYDLKSLAFDVATRCGGLPLAIVTIAKALRNKQVSEWKNALLELQHPSLECHTESMRQVYSCILLSYNHLESDELKSTFLLCCTMVLISDASLEELLRYSLGLNLIQRIKTVEEARHRVNTLIQKLKDSSLLLETPNDESFSIQEVVRHVGRVLAFKIHKNFIVDDIGDLLEMNTLKNCTSISLLDIVELPKELDCPHLTFFYMKTRTKFSVPDNFFNGMPNLKVLHLKEMDLSELPASLPSLKKLRTLYLDCCNLGDMAIVGDIKSLEILVLFKSLSETKLLSEEIGKLNRLRLLDLRRSSFIIPPKTISTLTQLEELYMDYWYDQPQVEELNIETSATSLKELKDLCHLTALHICVADAEILPKGMDFEKLKRYNILIGEKRAIRETSFFEDKWAIRETLRTLQVRSDTNLCSEDGVIKQLKGIEDLLLDGEQRIMNVLWELDGNGFPNLKYFHMKNNPFILCIVDSMLSTTIAFPLLETLSLSNLARLEKICHDQLRTKCFCQLRTIKVQRCHKLKNLFSFSIAQHLSVLQEIEVVDCGNIREIVFVDRADNGIIDPMFFEKLQSFTLGQLPRLRRIYSETEVASTSQERRMPLTMNASSSEIILKDQLDALPLFGAKVILPSLEKLKLSLINIQCKWLHLLPAMSSSCRTLTSLTLEDCSGNLKFVFSYSEVEWLVLLEKLAILNCKSIEGIINIGELKREGEVIKMAFPKLINLQLKGLPNLKQFGCGHSVEFPSLTQLSIEDCPELKTFSSALPLGEINCQHDSHPFFNKKVGFPSLESMVISGMDNVESLWHDQVLENSFCKLKSVEVNDCQMLTTIFPSFLCGILLKLESITVKSCGLVEEIFDLRELGKHSTRSVQLKTLYVDHLSNLKHIWNEDPKGMLSYGELQKVTIFVCPNLKNLFPASVGRSLANLESLEVSDCGVEKIIANEGMKEAAVRFSFPQLNSLQLHNLLELTTFYQAEHTVEMPYLKTLGLHHCDKFKSPFFSVEGTNQGYSKLEELQLSGNAIDQMKKQGQVSFGSLKSLELNDYESTDDSPLDFIQIFGSLGKLSLNFGSYIKIFSDAEVKEHPHIKHLVLSQLYNLQQIWKQGSKIDLLEILQVQSCACLTNLMPSSSSFAKLTILEVWGCEQLKNLLTFSTAKSLVQLEKLEVFDCKMLTEIVANEGATTEEITFKKMKSLSLSYLESLASFCPMKYILNFPVLESLVVNECPKMKIFSSGAMNTPRNCQLQLNWKAIKQSGEVDINTTIQQNMGKRLLGREGLE